MDSTPSVTHLGLGAGYGGIELGLKRAVPGLRTVALCEIEAFAIANLVSKMEAGLMDPAPIWPDLKTFPWAAFRDRVDILTGGYPCQPFSAAGKRLGGEDPRHLWPHISRGISILQPRVCFFENVEGHITCGLHHVLCDLGRLGYRTTWGLFSASECGAPHQRKRVFILAVASGFGGAAGISGPFPKYERQSGESDHSGHQAGWPSRPGEPQHGWEPPRVVGNTEGLRVERWQYDNSGGNRQGGGTQQSCGSSGSATEFRQTQLPLGRNFNEPSGGMDYAQLCISCDNRTDSGTSSECGGELADSIDDGCNNADSRPIEHGVKGSLGEETAQQSKRDRIYCSEHGQTFGNGQLHPDLYISCDNRTDELRLLGNGVVPATAALAFGTLMNELCSPQF